MSTKNSNSTAGENKDTKQKSVQAQNNTDQKPAKETGKIAIKKSPAKK